LRESVKERLNRVREIPHSRVANLLSVERQDETVVLIWEYIEGDHFETAITGKTLEETIDLAEDVVRCVEAFHAQGLVHGALHGRNIIIRREQAILIDVSPLLYTDFQDDIEALVKLFEPVLASHSRSLGVNGGKISLKELSEALERCRDEQVDDDSQERPSRSPRIRKSTFAAAVLVALIGLAISFAIWWYISHNMPSGPSAL
jgi:hypothetical protein